MKVHQLDHVALHVADVQQSTDFYANALRLEQLPRPAFSFPGAWFRLGERQELHLIGNRTEDVHSHNRENHFALLVEDLDAWESHFQANCIEYFPRKTRPDGAQQIFLIDPDGFFVELCQTG